MRELDQIDAQILLALDDDPQATVVALARRLGLARNTVQARLQRLQTQGLARFSRRVDPATLGYPMLAFVTLEISQGDIDHTVEALRAIPEILEAHATTGDGDLLARVVARNADDLHRVTRDMLASPSVMRTRTSVALREYIPLRTGPLLRRLERPEPGPAASAPQASAPKAPAPQAPAPAIVPDVQASASR
jgi:DNA-binding Lrp family transcriptional regulator